jgi:hypothetical protein
MKKTIITLTVACFAAFTGLRADTSYLLIQGPFGSGGAVETFKWQVNYQAGQLTKGFDLLTAALNPEQLQYSTYPFGNLVDGFTLNGTSVSNNYPAAMWIYYSADATGQPWTYSDSGAALRNLVNGSFDGWVFGFSTFDPDTFALISADPIVGGTNTPTLANFSTATVVGVPEPGSASLLLIGAGAMLSFLKRRRA